MRASMKTPSTLNRAVQVTWKQYCDTTFIHGVRYIRDPMGNIYTHLLWLSITTTSFILAITLVNTFWEAYKTNPTRMNVESVNVPITELDFPAVTFCNVNRLNTQRTKEFAQSLKIPSNMSDIHSSMITQWLQSTMGFSDYINEAHPHDLEMLQGILDANNISIVTTMQKLQQKCSDLLVRCRWEGKMVKCLSIFRVITTHRGICCSFNSKPSTQSNFTAIRTNQFGLGNGLSVVLAPAFEETSYGGVYTKGIRVLLNEPAAFPGDRSIEKIYPLGYENMAHVSGEQTNCSDMVRDLPIADRKCYFPGDYQLKYFDGYRENNCDTECRMDETLNQCQCIPFFFPNPLKLDVCNITRIPCLVQNYEFLYRQDINKSTIQCDCPSNCNGIYYDVRSNSAAISPTIYSLSPLYKDLNESIHMVVHVFFGSHDFMKLRRDLLSDVVVLIANLGGVFNLFLGISVLAMLEIPYFATVKLYANFRQIEDEVRKRDLFVSRLHVETLPKVLKLRTTQQYK